MAVERDEGTEDELIRNAVAELRRPVALDPAIDTRALDAIRGRRKAEGRRRWMAAAAAALAAGVALAVLPHPRDPRADETRQVQLLISAPASHVAVVGDFNDWDPVATPLWPTADPGVWTVE
ncbi:MAG: hypothetical protein ACREL3_02795, partial [Gemmatimonadales bacterium]